MALSVFLNETTTCYRIGSRWNDSQPFD